MKLLDTTGKLFSKDEAEKTCDILNAEEWDEWTYTAKHDPKGTGYSFIEITDENGEFVSVWT